MEGDEATGIGAGAPRIHGSVLDQAQSLCAVPVDDASNQLAFPPEYIPPMPVEADQQVHFGHEPFEVRTVGFPMYVMAAQRFRAAFLHGSAEKEEDVTFSAEDQRGLAVTDQPLAPQEYLDTWEAPAHESDWGRLHERYFSYGFLRETQRVENPSHGYVRAAFGGAGSPLYVHVPADADQRVFTGKASSVRQAGFDNNALLEERFRRFVVLRKTSPEPAAASFAAVIEPCRKQSRILRVTRPHAHVLRIVLDDRVDYVFRDLRDPFTTEEQGTTLRMRGAYGHASIRDGKLVHHHIVGAMVAVGETTAATGDPFSRIVAKRVNKKELTFEPGSPAEWTEAEDLGSFVRLDFSPHHRYGYFRNTLDPATGRLETQGPLGFSLTPDGGTMFRSFPQYRFAGPAQVTFFPTTYSAGP